MKRDVEIAKVKNQSWENNMEIKQKIQSSLAVKIWKHIELLKSEEWKLKVNVEKVKVKKSKIGKIKVAWQ